MIPTQVIEEADKIKAYLKDLWIDACKIEDQNLMLQAFIHKSFAKDFKRYVPDNERLEFVGDAVLWAIIAEFLYINFPDLPESQLTLYKINLIKEETLAQAARQINLWEYIFLGHWEEKTWGRNKDTILADSFEALVWFLWIALWYQQTKDFISNYLYTKFIDIIRSRPTKPYKNLLQEKVQKLYKTIPEYKDYEWEKDEKWNVLVYKSEVYILGEKKWEWYWPNKKKAQEEAAKQAYENWS